MICGKKLQKLTKLSLKRDKDKISVQKLHNTANQNNSVINSYFIL